MNSKPRIAFLGNNITPGGGSASLYLLVKSLNSNVFDKYVYASTCKSEEMKQNFLKHCKQVKLVELEEICSCQTFDTPQKKFEIIKRGSDKLAKLFLNELLNKKINILHVNNSVFPHVIEYVKKNSSIMIISHVRELIDHGGINTLQKFIIERIDSYSDKIITISNNEARIFATNKHVKVLPNPFDFSLIEKITSHYRVKNKIANDVVLVAMMGRYNYHKGHLDFLKALKIILKNKLFQTNFRFIIIGVSGRQPKWKILAKKILGREDYPSQVKKYIKENKLDQYLTLLPYTQNILEIIKDMDIIVRPSLSGDPWGRDIIEAMALSRPIVATGNSTFFIRDGISGFLTPPKDPEQLAKKISELINNEDRRKQFGNKGFEIIKQMCDINKYGSEIEKIYIEALKN
ncbi:MAG: glycosyltransferase family 4 protein [Bacteroidetes bacterium]|nr:glycosyltransferase family 4 protein [Bacteroidota bacterium]